MRACLRQLGGRRPQEVRFGRFLANPKATVERLIDGWGERTALAARGRHVLAVRDSSGFTLRTTPDRRRGLGESGLGESGEGAGRGALAHAMPALDAQDGGCLGLVAGRIWTRRGRVTVPHAARRLAAKESGRRLGTAEAAKAVPAGAATVTVIADRESGLHAGWARVPGPGFHLITRAMADRRLAGGGRLHRFGAAPPPAGTRAVEARARPGRRRRTARLTLRFGRVTVRRPADTPERGLPGSVTPSLVEVVEPQPPAGAEPPHWRLLTTHEVGDAASAWRSSTGTPGAGRSK